MEDLVLLDTGVLFDFLGDRGVAGEAERILEAGKGAISAITVFELYRGVSSKKHLEQCTKLLSFLHKIDLNEQVARIAGGVYTDLKQVGRLIENEDILIAATSIYYSFPLFTTNKRHFNTIPRVQMHNAD